MRLQEFVKAVAHSSKGVHSATPGRGPLQMAMGMAPCSGPRFLTGDADGKDERRDMTWDVERHG